MNPGATNTTHSLEELERLEHHVRASSPPPVGSPAHLFLSAMNDRRKAADAGNVVERDLRQTRAAFFYGVAVSQVNAVASSVATSAPPVRPLPPWLSEQLARTSATGGPAIPHSTPTQVANNPAPVPASTTNQRVLAQAEESARKSVPGFTLAGLGVTKSATAPLVSRTPGLPPLASACSPTSAGHGPIVVAGVEGGGPRPLPVSLRDQLAGARTQATESTRLSAHLTPTKSGSSATFHPPSARSFPPKYATTGTRHRARPPPLRRLRPSWGSCPSLRRQPVPRQQTRSVQGSPSHLLGSTNYLAARKPPPLAGAPWRPRPRRAHRAGQ